MYYQSVLLAAIEREKNGEDYDCSGEDRKLWNQFCDEVNRFASTDFHYLAELDTFNINGIGPIAINYIDGFKSETIRKILMEQVVADKVKGCDKMVYEWYMHFKSSDEYISAPGLPSPAHIHVSYDNVFRRLKPRRLKGELFELAHNIRDVHYLPFTMRMLASWKIPGLKEIFISYLSEENISPEKVGLVSGVSDYYPSVETIIEDVKYTALEGLKYYPSEDTLDSINHILQLESNSYLRETADKIIQIINNKLK